MESKVEMASKTKPRIRTAAPAVAPIASSGVPFKDVKKVGTNVLQFTLTPTNVSYANTLRRAILTMVETVAFNADIEEGSGNTTNVHFTKNNTPMSNEMLAHRIGLLPVHVTNPLEWKPDDYTVKLSVKNESFELRDITADDITVYKNMGPNEEPKEVPSRTFFHPHPVTGSTALLTVLKGRVGASDPDEIACTMRATVGNGKQNARFIPTSQCSYRYTPDPDPARRKQVFNDWLVSLKKVTPASLESNAQRKEELEREFATMEAARCYLEENGEPYSFDFTLESVGVLPPTYSVARALELLQARCLKYASMNVGDLPEGLKIVPADAAMQGFDFLFTGEDHTLGNLLSTYIEQNLMQEDSLVSFIGYKVPHPLRDEMLLRVGVEKDGQQISARAVVSQAAKGCADLFGAWRAAWETYIAQ